MNLSANYEVNTYLISLDPDGGTVSSDSISINYGDSYTLPIPTKNGYTFEGWYLDEEVMANNGTWTLTHNISLEAKWSINTYHITYNLNNGTIYHLPWWNHIVNILKTY